MTSTLITLCINFDGGSLMLCPCPESSDRHKNWTTNGRETADNQPVHRSRACGRF